MRELEQLLREAHFTVPRIRRLEKEAKNFRVGVIGDFYLDRYVTGRMEAISREAPVPIVRLYRDEFSPGAAGNIAMNLRSLGCSVSVLGPTGRDWAGEILRRRFREEGIAQDFLTEHPGWITPQFNKIYASVPGGHPQQVARFDQEPGSLSAEQVLRLFDGRLKEFLRDLHAVVIADYSEAAGNGWLSLEFVERVLRAAQEEGVRVFSTSRKRVHWLKGSQVAVLNELEMLELVNFLEQTLGEIGESFEANAHRTASFLGVERLYLTMGEKGIFVAEKGQPLMHVPTFPVRSGIDVTGAGDTAMAAIVLGELSGMPPGETALLGNLCAGVVIRKLCTTGSVSTAEIIAQIQRWRTATAAE